MTNLEQLCLLPESAYECRSALHGAQMAACTDGEITESLSTVVRHGVMFQIAPDAFDRVHLWCVGRQELQRDCSKLSFHVLAHADRAMCLQAVPDDQQFLADRCLQDFKELDDWGCANGPAVESKVEAPERHPRNHRQLLPVEAVLQHGGLAFRGPGTYATRSLGQTRFVDEDDHSTLSRSDFFSAGHLVAFQVRIAFSSRWRAWPVGRCTLQPSAPSSRHTEGSVRRTANRCSIRRAILGNVHNSVANPAASAPALRNLISSSHCKSESF